VDRDRLVQRADEEMILILRPGPAGMGQTVHVDLVVARLALGRRGGLVGMGHGHARGAHVPGS
jgi:hypothetical protein